MKKIFMIAVMAVAALTANAQVTITPHLGVGYSPISNLETISGKYNGGINATMGADVKYDVTEEFGISAGIDFRYMESDKINDIKLKYGTFEIPVLAHYNITKNLGVFAGAKFNFVADLKWSAENSYASYDANLKDNSQTTISIPVGLSYTFNTPWVLSAYYDIPTASISKAQGDNVKIGNICLSIGYKFSL